MHSVLCHWRQLGQPEAKEGRMVVVPICKHNLSIRLMQVWNHQMVEDTNKLWNQEAFLNLTWIWLKFFTPLTLSYSISKTPQSDLLDAPSAASTTTPQAPGHVPLPLAPQAASLVLPLGFWPILLPHPQSLECVEYFVAVEPVPLPQELEIAVCTITSLSFLQ